MRDENDGDCGFMRVEAREIDEIGTEGIIKKIWDRVGKNHAYLSVDIDVLDPAYAPATGTPETGGWSTRELRTIIRGLDGMKLVGMDLVEVATPYDTVIHIVICQANETGCRAYYDGSSRCYL